VWRPPATQGDLEVLNNRARAIMFSLSQTLIEAEAALKQPPTYMPQSSRLGVDPDVYNSEVAPRRSRRDTPQVTASSTSGTLPARQRPAPYKVPATSRAPIETKPSASATSPPKLIPPSADVSIVTTTHLPHRQPGNLTTSPRGVTHGTIMGTLPPPASVLGSDKQPSRVNPHGGVISGAQPPGLLATGRPGDLSERRQDRIHRSADSPWKVAKGVPPILQAPTDLGSFDPGPAIGIPR
jgi:hypothetical protein